MTDKKNNSYKTISEVVKILGLKSKRAKSIPTHTIRYWEKEFKQIKPKIFYGNRRYYDQKDIKIIEKIHFLLKDQGMTINGVKKILNGNRRYYDKKNIDLIRKVHFLLKDQGMTIKGVKKILSNLDTLKLDENLNESIKAHDIRNKLVKISNMIKNLKDNK